MTTDQAPTDLIRYPVSVDPACLEIILDADKNVIIRIEQWAPKAANALVATEIVRVMNAAHEQISASQSMIDSVTATPSEPSEAAMKAAVNILKSMGIVSISKEHAYTEIIDTAFAAERAEAARTIRLLREADEEAKREEAKRVATILANRVEACGEIGCMACRETEYIAKLLQKLA